MSENAVQNPPEGYQRVIPYLYYRNAPAVLDHLVACFGFTERYRMAGPDGKVMHAELSYGDSVLMIASVMERPGEGPAMACPSDYPGRTGLVAVYVDDVNAHHAHAKEAGADVVSGPEDQFYGDRTYRARDPEGGEWYFLQHVKDVSEEDMAAASGGE